VEREHFVGQAVTNERNSALKVSLIATSMI
jgi:hypothetical protein